MNHGQSDLLALLDADHVMMVGDGPSKKPLLRRMTRRLAELDGLGDPDGILSEILRREAESSTGVGHRVAIPHATFGLDRPHAMIARVEPAVDFRSVDGQGVDLVFLVLTPFGGERDYLRLLAEIARLTRNQRVTSRLWNADSPRDFLRRLRREAGPAAPHGRSSRAVSEVH